MRSQGGGRGCNGHPLPPICKNARDADDNDGALHHDRFVEGLLVDASFAQNFPDAKDGAIGIRVAVPQARDLVGNAVVAQACGRGQAARGQVA